ncbi:MAG: HAD family hydrolase [Candidatus Parvarchaeum sp.]
MSVKIKAKAIIFDFDNTLVDTHSAINGAYSDIASKLSERFNLGQDFLRERIFSAQKEIIDNVPLEKRTYDRRKVIKQLNEDMNFKLTEKEIDELAESFYSFILEHITYPEYTESVLQTLKKRGKKLGLLTDTDVKPGLKKQRLDRLSFTKLFDAILIAGETIPQRKNSPIPFLELSRMLGVKPVDTIVIGDRMDADIDNAKEAGMKAILIDMFLPPNTGIHKPDFQIHDLREALDIID